MNILKWSETIFFNFQRVHSQVFTDSSIEVETPGSKIPSDSIHTQVLTL